MISFILPTYNEEKAIAETISRLKRNFTLAPYEIIVTDDQSTDDTVRIAKSYADKVVSAETKSTIAANRNRGAKVAKYPYLVFVDSGVEIPEPNKFFETVLKKFESSPNLLSLAPRVHITPSLATLTDKIFIFLLDVWFTLANNVLGQGLATGKLQVIKKEAFEKLGGYNENLVAGEDNDLFNRLSKIGRTRFETSLTVYHLGRREHALGWIKLISIWFINSLSVMIFKKAASKEWKAIR